MRILKWLVTALVLVVLFGGSGFGAPLELKFGHVGAPGSLFDLSANEFAKRANAKLGDKAKVVVFGSSQIGKDEELMQKLKLGTVDLALPSTVMSSLVDVFGLFELPYLVKSRAHMRKIRDGVFWEKLAPAAEEKGYKVLAVWENGFRQITNNARPINVPEDLKSIKLRVPKGVWRVKMFQAYGANPTPIALSEVFVALQTNVIDGQENPLAQIASQKFQEVQKYLSLTEHVYTPAFVTAGTGRWEKLPKDVRKILENTAKGMQEFVYATAEKLDKDLLKELSATMKVNTANKEAFIKASGAIYDEFGATVPGGKELIERVKKLAK
ncbi:MAG: TRAP transporter substrate-binding protein [Nitrospirota bacterium]